MFYRKFVTGFQKQFKGVFDICFMYVSYILLYALLGPGGCSTTKI